MHSKIIQIFKIKNKQKVYDSDISGGSSCGNTEYGN